MGARLSFVLLLPERGERERVAEEERTGTMLADFVFLLTMRTGVMRILSWMKVYRSPTPTDNFITTTEQTDGASFGNLSGLREELRDCFQSALDFFS